ncbi:lipoprotein, putative [Citrifermentans bemidjiense Bem]|uniref:Lipoprotein, putative n=1 Tax=Citrifermentans bemidjiense (strain ATCC BAA-1014 / DSM 16622 / JCM 12645 / Bem) TaxID=404380 RepID=B5EH46_CITBB|nr:hypothetical protein [Citrifermentans bemidjiense]ACH38148.1 lipoprotein, putative [Citrifermentans bemidjiense Bem]
MKRLVVGILVLVSLATVISCSKPESRLIGKWVGKSGSFQFNENKTGVMNPPAGVNLPHDIRFSWALRGDDSIQLSIQPPVAKNVLARFEGKKVLVIEDDKFVKE